MTNEQKLRGFAVKWGCRTIPSHDFTDDKYEDESKECLSDLTALISEGYVERAKYDELLQQRDELMEALTELVHLHGCEQEGIGSGQPTPQQWYDAVNKAEAAIKNTKDETDTIQR